MFFLIFKLKGDSEVGFNFWEVMIPFIELWYLTLKKHESKRLWGSIWFSCNDDDWIIPLYICSTVNNQRSYIWKSWELRENNSVVCTKLNSTATIVSPGHITGTCCINCLLQSLCNFLFLCDHFCQTSICQMEAVPWMTYSDVVLLL